MASKSPPKVETQTPVAPAIHITESGRKGLKLYEREIATYLRELPRLLAEGLAWQHVLIKDDEIVGVWKAQGDAITAGRDRFGLEPIFVKTIHPQDAERFALVFAQKDGCGTSRRDVI
jgi:hypothetical protein